VVKYIISNGVKIGYNPYNGCDDDGDDLIDEHDEISFINWLDDDGDGLVDEGIDEEWDLNDANEDYDSDGVWYTIAWVDDDSDGEFDEDAMDDDSDGLIDEDPVDGRDNDNDGLFDEDTGGIEDDNDMDGLIDEDPKKYYHPFTNWMEFQCGIDMNNDGIFEKTTDPNSKDSDGDLISDGFELWYSDYIYDINNPEPFQDNDSLPRGWEELFNGSLVLFPTDYVPRGLLDPEDAINFVGNFNPDKNDSNDNGILDSDENYDGDMWVDLLDLSSGKYFYRNCTNLDEYRGHSDPTSPKSVPKNEYRFRVEVGHEQSDSINEMQSFNTILLLDNHNMSERWLLAYDKKGYRILDIGHSELINPKH
jgi:hypothetical protein